MAASPEDAGLALRALDQALAAGDQALAVRAARTLERAGMATAEARFTLLADALTRKNWKAASAEIAALDEDRVFMLMTPVLKAWLSFETKKRDALAQLDAAGQDRTVGSYIAEHRALLLLALGQRDAGLAALEPLIAGEGGRAQRLRIAAAATLQRRRDRAAAETLLAGDKPPVAAARAMLAANQPIPGAIDSARSGIAEFLARLAADIAGQNAPGAGVGFARLSTFLAPENSETWLVASDLLAATDHRETALAALDAIPAGDPFRAAVQDSRVRLLAATGDREGALARAEAAAKREGANAAEWTRLGDLYTEAKKYTEAAEAYGQALTLASDSGPPAKWTLHLLRGSALEQGGRWNEAKPELEAAYKLAPDQPIVLNYLGYAQLERRENIVEAEKLVREASRLQPNDAAITDSLGWALHLNGKTDQAIPLLERAAVGEPNDPAIHEHLGDAYYSVGRRIEARFAWAAALAAAEEDEDSTRIRAKIDTGLTPQLASP
ncbi:tetratricopeptide repeat protein [Allosphingosinicella indica]|uniref:Tetratricopeptide repeat-containing protein n=1 Tax=Allosphingosinicella indica TaxID=941907 RepID=A0A1X7FXM7_9SPHN|nr:tetratricopeptide repeat protein [Allosphingosinicella indica]SMF60616.1 Tetratricopeptide repeat-containing protein [Allosphingosinicella indica]